MVEYSKWRYLVDGEGPQPGGGSMTTLTEGIERITVGSSVIDVGQWWPDIVDNDPDVAVFLDWS